MINNLDDIKNYLNDNFFKKIFILCGKNSFISSGAKKEFEILLKNKENKFYYKNSSFPIFEELIKIIKEVRLFKPDLIILDVWLGNSELDGLELLKEF